jgi:hypothetical protein
VSVDIDALIQTLIPLLLVAWAVVLFMRKQPAPTMPADARLIEMIDRLQVELNEVKAELREMQDWASRLSAQVISLGGRPVTLRDIENASKSSSVIHRLASGNRATLISTLKNDFSIDEIELIATELGARGGALGDGDIDARVAKLMQWAQRENKMMELAFIVWRERPDVGRN